MSPDAHSFTDRETRKPLHTLKLYSNNSTLQDDLKEHDNVQL